MNTASTKSIRYLVQAAVIAAIYAVLTLLASSLNLAYGPVQFRISEFLTVLPMFTPAAIPGLTLGCFLANLASPFGPVDWIFGSVATLLAAVVSYLLRNVRIKDIPFWFQWRLCYLTLWLWGLNWLVSVMLVLVSKTLVG